MAAFAAWAACVGFGLMGTDDFFRVSPTWIGLKNLNPNDTAWGILMMWDACLLMLAVRIANTAFRATITLFSSILWGCVGMSLCYYGYMNNIVSIIGPFSILCSIQGFFAVGIWTSEVPEV